MYNAYAPCGMLRHHTRNVVKHLIKLQETIKNRIPIHVDLAPIRDEVYSVAQCTFQLRL